MRWRYALPAMVLLAMSAAPFQASAASLYFSPAAKTVSVGDIFTIAVYVSSPDQAMNAASGNVTFPSDKLRVLSVSTGGSAVNLWVQNPSFTNAASGGIVTFAGVMLNPGFSGAAGDIIAIRFQAVSTGDASLAFSTGSVLANNGSGTNILQTLGTAEVAINPAPTGPSSTAPVAPAAPAAPIQPALPTSTAPVVPPVVATTAPPTVTVNGWFGAASQAIILWGGIIALALALLAALAAVIIYLVNRLRRLRLVLHRHLVRERQGLRDDLRRVEGELETDDSFSTRKRRERLLKEVERLEADLKRDIEESDRKLRSGP